MLSLSRTSKTNCLVVAESLYGKGDLFGKVRAIAEPKLIHDGDAGERAFLELGLCHGLCGWAINEVLAFLLYISLQASGSAGGCSKAAYTWANYAAMSYGWESI